MDRGVVVSDMQNEYGRHHIRICRPSGLSDDDNTRVIRFIANHLGYQYDFRYIVDLFRFLIPSILFPHVGEQSSIGTTQERDIKPSALPC